MTLSPLRGRSINLFLLNGTPYGLRTALVGSWHGLAVACPRADVGLLKGRGEAQGAGVYFLLGPVETVGGGPRVYVGETDIIWKRIAQHERTEQKDWWTTCVAFSAHGDVLTKAHVRWLEAKLYAELHAAGRCTLKNIERPKGGRLPEAEATEMERYLEHLRLVAGVLGLDVFALTSAAEPVQGSDQPAASQDIPTLEMSGGDYKATCEVRDGRFVVQPGSLARTYEADHVGPDLHGIRHQLLENGVLERVADNPKSLRFTKEYPFESPSGAARVILGSSANGRIAWRVQGTDQTYADWQDAQLRDNAGEDL